MSNQQRKDQQTTANQAERDARDVTSQPVRDLETLEGDAGAIRGGALRRSGDPEEEEDVGQL